VDAVTPVTLTSEERNRHVVVRLSGEVDLANADDLGAEVRRVVENKTFALAVELCEVTYFDSAGVRLLFELAGELRARRQELVVVVRPGSAIERVLEMVAFDRVATLATDLDEALANVRIQPRLGDSPL
jgi:anti-sigma B factor antagonist/stage II sporulation protein AA (anti-sigma F factor antagonist)